MSRRFWMPTIFMALYLPLSPSADLAVERRFFRAGSFSSLLIWRILYHYGSLVPLAGGCLALFWLCRGFRWPGQTALQRAALVYLAALVLGCGAATHLIGKEIWSRPRPVQLREFGGFAHFCPLYRPVGFLPFPQRSFPSGHVGAGMSFLALICIGSKERRRDLQWIGLTLCTLSGGSLAVARMAQGGHFLSDVLGTTYLMWCFCLVIERALYKGPRSIGKAHQKRRRSGAHLFGGFLTTMLNL